MLFLLAYNGFLKELSWFRKEKWGGKNVSLQAEYRLRFYLLYDNKTLGQFSISTFRAQEELARNFIALFQLQHRVKIFRVLPFYIMQSGDPQCGSGFCSRGNISANTSLIRHRQTAVTACSDDGSRIGTGFYFEMGQVEENDPVFGYVSAGFEVLQLAQKLHSEQDRVFGNLEIEFQWWGEYDGYISW